MPEPGLIAKQVSLIIGLPWWPQIGSVVINVNYIKARVRIKEAGVGRRQWRAHAVRNSRSVTVEGREFGFLVSSSCNGLAAPSPNKKAQITWSSSLVLCDLSLHLQLMGLHVVKKKQKGAGRNSIFSS